MDLVVKRVLVGSEAHLDQLGLLDQSDSEEDRAPRVLMVNPEQSESEGIQVPKEPRVILVPKVGVVSLVLLVWMARMVRTAQLERLVPEATPECKVSEVLLDLQDRKV